MRLSDLDKPYTIVSYCPYCGNEDRSLLILHKQTFLDVTEAKCTIGCKCCGGKFDCYVLADELVEKRINELKPCPFCGNEVNVEKIPLWYANGRGYSGCYEFKIKCDDCGCTVNQPKNDSIYRSEEKARENAIKAWNRRVKDET